MSTPEDDRTQEERALGALDAYVNDLQAGRRPDRERLLSEFPPLSDAIGCVEALERLVQSAAPELAETRDYVPAAAHDAPRTEEPPALGAWSARPAVGQFGDYELIEELGRGGMGVVYKAWQKSLGRLVALKMILPTALPSEQAVLRFQVEARAAAPAPSQRGSGPPGGAVARPALLYHGLRARPRPECCGQGSAHGSAVGRPPAGASGRRRRPPARAWDHPSGPEALEHPGRGGWLCLRH